MARSKHTDTRRVRAARRVRAPRQPRGDGDLSRRRALGMLAKAFGLPPAAPATAAPGAWTDAASAATPAPVARDDTATITTAAPAAGDDLASAADGGPTARGSRRSHAAAARPPAAPAPLPRLRVQRPRAGHAHPAARSEIIALLRCLGETCSYGLRAVELVRAPSVAPAGRLLLGHLRVPGRVRLYDQPLSPWCLPGQLAPAAAARLTRAGAIVELVAGGQQTRVAWPGDTLRDFMLFDVLLHEIGHHLLQQYTGKRRARIARTRDHEAFAEAFAQRARRQFQADHGEAP
jgi:hypothetical protein